MPISSLRASASPAFAKEHGNGSIDEDQIESAARQALAPFDRDPGPDGEDNPYRIQHELRERMQNLVGIVRTESEMMQVLVDIQGLRERAAGTAVPGNREYNPGWHTALDLHGLLTVAEAVARAALQRKESRGAHFRTDYPDKEESFAKTNFVIRKEASGGMSVHAEPLPQMPSELGAIIEEMK